MNNIQSLILNKKNLSMIVEQGGLSHNIDDYPFGIIIPINKEYRWTSADIVRKIKFQAIKHFNKKKLKVGHAGTLDPLATGVLLVCIGSATKLAEELQKHDKEYLAQISFGATTTSYDLEKEIDRTYPINEVTKENIITKLQTFIGEQEQVAPLFSAKSVEGLRAYELARMLYTQAKEEGQSFQHEHCDMLQTQKIKINYTELIDFENGEECKLSQEDHSTLREQAEQSAKDIKSRIITMDYSSLNLPKANIIIGCSKGTYIRAFARDLGESLSSGAFLSKLCRTKSGNFNIEDCINVNEAIALFNREK